MANISFKQNILPKTDNTYYLGNSSYKWHAYLATINGQPISSLFLPAVTSGDNNKILAVSNGQWTTITAPYLTSHQDISGKANSADLATVATSGSYNDLSNKPTIPAKVSDLTNDSGFITSSAIPTNVSTFTNDAGYLTSVNNMTGATSSASGAAGLVPAPTSADTEKFLRGDGAWAHAVSDAEELYEGYISTDTQSVATFDAKGADNPITLTTAIEPVQNLNGYDHPWPAGAINVIPPAAAGTYTSPSGNITVVSDGNGKYTITGTSNGNENVEIPLSGTFVCPPSTTHKLCIMNNAASDYVVMNFYYNGTFVTDWSVTPINRVVTSYFQMVNQSINKIVIQVRNNTTANIVMTPMIIPQASDNSPFIPYSNICPISGWTGAKVTRTGFNVWDEEWEVGRFDTSTGADYAVSNCIRSKNIIPIVGGKTYYFKSSYYLWVILYDANQQVMPISSYDIGSRGKSGNSWTVRDEAVLLPSNARYLRFYELTGSYDNNTCINYPSTETGYHSGSSNNTLSITFPTSAGTVYGGTLTVNKDGTGTLYVDKGYALFNGSESWNVQQTIGRDDFNFYILINDAVYSIGEDIKTNLFKSNIYSNPQSGTVYISVTRNINITVGNMLGISTTSAFKAYLAEHNLQVLYKLANPVTYDLSAPQIATLLGVNNVWADTGDILSLSYSDAVEGGTDLTLITTGERYEWNKAVQKVLPSVTSSDNGKFLQVINGAWAVVTVPIQSYYTGNEEPSSSLGSNGDIYLIS